MKYAYSSYGYSTILKNIYENVYEKTVGNDIQISIDQESSPKNTFELLSEIREKYKSITCNIMQQNNNTINAISSLIPMSQNQTDEELIELSLLVTNATKMDPGSNAFRQNRKYLPLISETNDLNAYPEYDIKEFIMFFGVPIIIYNYNKIPERPSSSSSTIENVDTSITYNKIFRKNKLIQKNSDQLSVSKVTFQIVIKLIPQTDTRPTITYLSFLKTLAFKSNNPVFYITKH